MHAWMDERPKERMNERVKKINERKTEWMNETKWDDIKRNGMEWNGME